MNEKLQADETSTATPEEVKAEIVALRSEIRRFISGKMKGTAQNDLEDMVQIISMKAINSAASYKHDKASVRTWLSTIAKNAVIDYYRENSTKDKVLASGFDMDDESQDLASKIPNPESHAMYKQRKARLHEAILQIPNEKVRKVMLLYLREETYEEIASELQMNLGSVKSNIHRGKELIKEILGEDFDEIT